MDSNEAKKQFLGMPYGTACGRLRKQLLFKLVRDAKLDTCFQCNEQIETVEEFSIEHKRPWFRANAELFWDLDNIAFSHLGCNSRAKRSPIDKQGPDGTKWCPSCEKFKLLGDFRRRIDHRYSDKNIPASYCRSCANEKHNEYRHKVGLRGKNKRAYSVNGNTSGSNPEN